MTALVFADGLRINQDIWIKTKTLIE